VKPIRIATSGLTNTIYALRNYTERAGHVVSSAKDDVTAQAIQAVVGHARICERDDCECEGLREAAKNNYHLRKVPAQPASLTA
jgi:hypothetical protein